MLEEQRVGSCIRQHGSTDALIGNRFVFVRVADPELVTLAIVVEDAPRNEIVMSRVGNIRMDRPFCARCQNHCLLVIIVLVSGKQKCRFLAVTEGARKRTLKIRALLGRFPGGSAWVVAVYVGLLGSPALLGWRALLIFTLMLAGVGSADQLIDFRDLRGLRSGMRRK